MREDIGAPLFLAAPLGELRRRSAMRHHQLQKDDTGLEIVVEAGNAPRPIGAKIATGRQRRSPDRASLTRLSGEGAQPFFQQSYDSPLQLGLG